MQHFKAFYTSDGISHCMSGKSALCDLVKIKNWSLKHVVFEVEAIRTYSFSFSSSFYDSAAYNQVKTRLLERDAGAEEPTNCKHWNQAL